jgi:hypothetical protein
MDYLCKKCDIIGPHSIRPNGTPQHHCMECQREYSREHYAKNKHKHNKRRYEHTKRRRSMLREHMRRAKDKPCADCGVRYPYYVMQFDHLGDKSFTIGQDYFKYSLSKLEEEIAKCEVVCANCHAIRTHRQRDVG